jgi:hypothetical protein
MAQLFDFVGIDEIWQGGIVMNQTYRWLQALSPAH